MNIRPELAHLATPIDEVKNARRNPRLGDVELIRDSLRFHGQYRPILGRKQTGEILAGNHTLQAAIAEGWTEIAVQWLDVADDDDAERILLVDNKTSDAATYEQVTLGDILRELPDLDGTGFTAGEVEHLIKFGQSLDETPAHDPAPDGPDAITRRGDLIELGRHRLYCGDARDPNAWSTLMGADVATMLWTDPPYGVNLHDIAAQRGRDHGEMAGDDIDPMALHELARETFAHAHAYTQPGAAFYVAHADTVREPIADALRATGWQHAQTLIWVKDSLVLGRQDYQWRHEPILYGWRAGDAHHWQGDRSDTTIVADYADRAALEALEHTDLVDLAERLLAQRPGTLLRIARPKVADTHPTSKPVDLVALGLRNSSIPGDLIVDPFAGSGTTMIAADQLDRSARLIELDPGYCDVICARWTEHTGNKPKRPARRKKAKA